ncbi:MAG: DUF1302 family protein [Deltaproteobacteria bacterium]|nr:DUF1302 family protein [Deltaproteobacteria bacterium]
MNKIICLFFIAAFLFCLTANATFAFQAYDGKLDLKGSIQQTLNIKTHQDERDIRYNSFRTTVRGELLYKFKETPDLDLNFYTLANYYYDAALEIDSNMRYSVRHEGGDSDKYRDVRRPRDSEEWLKETYFDLKYDDCRIKLGKQLVSWGETAESRVADLINPLDLKYIIAFPDWEDYKLGLWMARMFYSPQNMWQDLSFELVVIPFNFVETRYPPAGHGAFVGQPILGDGKMQKVLDSQRRDTPDESFKNLELGFRIKGYSNIGEGVDWYLSNFYTRLDSPIINGKSGMNRLIRLMLFNNPGGRVWTYPHYNSTAFSFSTTASKIKSVIKGECALNTKRDYNYGKAANNANEIKERNLLTTALTFDRKTMIPWLSEMNRNEPFNFSFTWYQYWLFNHEYDKRTGKYILGETGRDSSLTKFTLSVNTSYFFSTLIPAVNIAYETNGSSTIVGQLVYMPTFHWQFVAYYQQFNEAWGSDSRYGNQVGLSIKYDF